MGEDNFWPPTESTPLDQSPKNWLLVVTSATPTSMPNLVQIRPWGASGRMDEIWQKNYLFLYTFSRELTYRPGPSTDFHAWWFKWCELMQGCAFWGFAILLPILGVQYPQNPIFGGMNRRFQAKRAKYWKLHVIETTASISTKFCTMSGHRGWSQSCPVNPKWQTATILKKKPLNCHISATIWWILMKFGRMTHIVPIQWIYH